MAIPSHQPQFMLLLRQPHGGADPGPNPEELGKIMGRFAIWMGKMKDQGIVVRTNGLEAAGAVLRGPRGATLTDGPYLESKEIIGGYVVIKADDLEQAIEHARACPGLDYRLSVEVRPVSPCSQQ